MVTSSRAMATDVTFSAIENSGKKCIRVEASDPAAGTQSVVYDVGPVIPGSVTECPNNEQRVAARVTPQTWLVLSERFLGSGYYTTAPFQVQTSRSAILRPELSKTSKADWPSAVAPTVYADVVSGTLTVGGTTPPAGFVEGACATPGACTPPPPVPDQPRNTHISKKTAMYIGVAVAAVVIIVVVIVLAIELPRRNKAKLVQSSATEVSL